jgi:hypothetical protein
MATSSWTRRRAGLVVAASAAAVLTATSMAGAHEGTDDENVLHGCVNDGSGALRVVSATSPECRPNETPVHWPLKSELPAVLADGRITYDEIEGDIELPPGSVDGSTVQDGSLTTSDLQDGTVIAADVQDGTLTGQHIANGSLFGWDIANGSLTGDHIALGSLTGAHIANGSLTGDHVGNGSLTGDHIANGSLTGDHITLGSLTGDHIPESSLTGGHIADGTLSGADLADGAVTPGKIAPVVQSGSGSGLVPLVSPQELGATVVPVSPGSLVMVSGQVQMRRDCSPCVPNVQHVVRYRVVRDGTPVGPEYRLELSADHRFDVASVSVLDSGFTSAGSATYAIRLEAESGAAGVDIMATDAVLTAQVLGGQ